MISRRLLQKCASHCMCAGSAMTTTEETLMLLHIFPYARSKASSLKGKYNQPVAIIT